MEKIVNILAVETSCDDTAASIIAAFCVAGKLKKFEIFSNIISSQASIHAGYGGVYPALAKREHQKNLPQVFKKAVRGFDRKKIDFIGITAGPGLDPCLWTGINFVQELMRKERKPAVPVNHVEAHILANLLTLKGGESKLKKTYLPAACLAVSGGHTVLFLMNDIGDYELLGETRDDAAGECFDKVARILGLGYPGGPVISEYARRWKAREKDSGIAVPRPMIGQKNYDFSFSGLKTAVLYHSKKQTSETGKSEEYIEAMSYEVEQAIVDVLVSKTRRAAQARQAKAIIIGGGVAANEELRRRMEIVTDELGIKFLAPPKEFCADNAAMIGVAAFFNRRKGEILQKPEDLKTDPNLAIE